MSYPRVTFPLVVRSNTRTVGGSNGYDIIKSNILKQNLAVGYQSLASATSGLGNVCIGQNAGADITTSDYNTCTGLNSGANITTGDGNTCIGAGAGEAISTGERNACVGKDAGHSISSGIGNTCIGKSAGELITTGGQNVCVGKDAGDTLVSGSGNVLIGDDALATATGSNNVVVGQDAQALDNYGTALGYNAIAVYSNSIALGAGATAVAANTLTVEATDGSYFNGRIQHTGTVVPRSVETQITSASTSVTLNAQHGHITTVSQNLAADTSVSFTVYNNNVDTNGSVFVSIKSYSGSGTPIISVSEVVSGSFVINIHNVSPNIAVNDVIVITFFVVRHALPPEP